MKCLFRILLSIVFVTPVVASTSVLGDVAQAIYELIPGPEVKGNFPNIRSIKIAGEIKCSLRNDDSYKCIVPDKGPDGRVPLGKETSEIFYNLLQERDFTTNLGRLGRITCVHLWTENEPSESFPFCVISL